MCPRLCLVLWLSGLPALGSPFVALKVAELDVTISDSLRERQTPPSIAPTTPKSTPLPYSVIATSSFTVSVPSPLPTPTNASPLAKRNGTVTEPTKQCTKIPANPNVSGIGIRIWSYPSALLAIVFPNINSFTSAFAINSFILVLTAITTTGKKCLSRYHAFIVRTYLTCAGQILMISPTPPGRGSRIGRLLFQDNGFYPFLFLKTLWLVLNYSGYDDGGPNPECNYLLEQPPLVFTSQMLSDRNSRIVSTLLELMFAAIIVVIKNLPSGRQESFRRMRSSWIGVIISIFSNMVPAVTTIERWIHRHNHLVDGSENDMVLFGQIMTVMTLISVVKDTYNHFQRHGWPQRSRRNVPKREKVD